ncbi:unnamed protein product [Brachionus calyciflorus]|uniref:CCHC-type domain-containing protein n=1 Tax=Brachionus calyciflorus TaxID=104777 RepID=A0A813V5N2_9BILA|nr:unnamed protein product [Brachionus calyciflorus]
MVNNNNRLEDEDYRPNKKMRKNNNAQTNSKKQEDIVVEEDEIEPMNGTYIKRYLAERWIFKPLQCLKSGILGHKIAECESNENTCLRCGKKGHNKKECKIAYKDLVYQLEKVDKHQNELTRYDEEIKTLTYSNKQIMNTKTLEEQNALARNNIMKRDNKRREQDNVPNNNSQDYHVTNETLRDNTKEQNHENVTHTEICTDISKWNCGDHLALSCSLDETSEKLKNYKIETKKQAKIVWNSKTIDIFNNKLQNLLHGVNDLIPGHVLKDKNSTKNHIEKLVSNLNRITLEAAEDITEENLIKKHKMKLNGW